MDNSSEEEKKKEDEEDLGDIFATNKMPGMTPGGGLFDEPPQQNLHNQFNVGEGLGVGG